MAQENSDTLQTKCIIAMLEQEIEKKDKLIAEQQEMIRKMELSLEETSKKILEENERFALEVNRLTDEVTSLYECVGLVGLNIETTKAAHKTDSPLETALMGEIRKLQALVVTLSIEKNGEENRILTGYSLYANSTDRTIVNLKESMKKVFLSFRRLCLQVFGWEITFDQSTKLWKLAFWKDGTKCLMLKENEAHHFDICESSFAHDILIQELAERYGIEDGLFISHLTQELTNLNQGGEEIAKTLASRNR